MGQQIQKVCQHKLGEQWKDGCCTDNAPVDNISLKPNAIASAVEQSVTTPTQVQHSVEATAV